MRISLKSGLLLGAFFGSILCVTNPADAARGYSGAYLNLRAGPDVGYPVVAQIPAYAKVNIEGCVYDWSWCDVSWGRERGWVSGKYLHTDYRNRRVRIPESGQYTNIPIIEFIFGNYWDNHYRTRPFYRDRDRYIYIYNKNSRGKNWHDNDRHDRDNDNDHRDRGRDNGRDWDRDRNHDDRDRDDNNWNRSRYRLND